MLFIFCGGYDIMYKQEIFNEIFIAKHKSFLNLILAFVLILPCIVFMSACSKKEDKGQGTPNPTPEVATPSEQPQQENNSIKINKTYSEIFPDELDGAVRDSEWADRDCQATDFMSLTISKEHKFSFTKHEKTAFSGYKITLAKHYGSNPSPNVFSLIESAKIDGVDVQSRLSIANGTIIFDDPALLSNGKHTLTLTLSGSSSGLILRCEYYH